VVLLLGDAVGLGHGGTNEPQERVPTHRHREASRQAGAGLSAGGEGNHLAIRAERLHTQVKDKHLVKQSPTGSSGYLHPARHLPVALPVGPLVRNQGIVYRRLDMPPEIHRPRRDPMLPP